MANFEIKTSGIFNTEYAFVGNEKDLWAWMKDKFDTIDEFTVTKFLKDTIVAEKFWMGSMKNGKITKTKILG